MNLDTIQAVFFDLNGLLVNTDELYYKAMLRYLLEQHNVSLSTEEFSEIFGLYHPELLARLAEKCPNPPDLATLNQELLNRIDYSKVLLKKGARQVLYFLQHKEMQLGLVTNSLRGEALYKLYDLGVEEYFSIFVSVERVNRGKPAPDIYLEAVRLSGLTAGECLVLEDSQAGVVAALAADCPVWFVPNPYIQNPAAFAGEACVPLFANLEAVLQEIKKPAL